MDIEAKVHEQVHNAFEASRRTRRNIQEMTPGTMALKIATLALLAGSFAAMLSSEAYDEPSPSRPTFVQETTPTQ